MVLGLALLVASLFFGLLKFRDVFYTSQHEPTPSTSQTDVNDNPASDLPSMPEPVTTEVIPKAGKTGELSLVVNKLRPLNPKTYVPSSLVVPKVKLRSSSIYLRSDAAAAIQKLFDEAKTAGHNPMLRSGYRSYSTQVSVYNSYVAKDGRAAADTYSARPGHSEHQTGLAADVCNVSNCQLEQAFGDTPFGLWLAKHSHEYGFVIRYLKGKQNITGYIYEPWHLRFVGTELAAQIYKSGKTLEEFYSLPPAPNYP